MIQKIIYRDRQEWLEKRKSSIGGSDASCIMGMNPWKSNVELYREKMRLIEPEDISNKEEVRYGVNAESVMRELFRVDFPELRLCYEDNNVWLNTDYPFAHASLDGWLYDQDGRLGIWENKTTMISSQTQYKKWRDRIPDYYYCQVLWYMMVTNAEFAYLNCLFRRPNTKDREIKRYQIERSQVEGDIEIIAKCGQRFADYLKTGTEPPLALPPVI